MILREEVVRLLRESNAAKSQRRRRCIYTPRVCGRKALSWYSRPQQNAMSAAEADTHATFVCGMFCAGRGRLLRCHLALRDAIPRYLLGISYVGRVGF